MLDAQIIGVKNPVYFEIIGEIKYIETIVIGGRIRDIMRIQKQFGHGRGVSLKVLEKFVLKVAGYAMPNYTGTKPTALAERK